MNLSKSSRESFFNQPRSGLSRITLINATGLLTYRNPKPQSPDRAPSPLIRQRVILQMTKPTQHQTNSTKTASVDDVQRNSLGQPVFIRPKSGLFGVQGLNYQRAHPEAGPRKIVFKKVYSPATQQRIFLNLQKNNVRVDTTTTTGSRIQLKSTFVKKQAQGKGKTTERKRSSSSGGSMSSFHQQDTTSSRPFTQSRGGTLLLS